MNYDEFVGKVRERAALSGMGAVNAIRATLMTLGERLYGSEPGHLAAQLPHEFTNYLTIPEVDREYTLEEFYQRVAELDDIKYEKAVRNAQVVIHTMVEAVSDGEIEDVLSQLPDEYNLLFTKS
jgi:uncharacterized protein (DUF2267 family)